MLEKKSLLYLSLFLISLSSLFAQETPLIKIVKPSEIYDVLNNPGIGFTTFQRFNGDDLNKGMGWTEGMPIDYQEFDGNLTNKNHPQTSIAYFRVYWTFVEPEQGQYNWPMIDKALRTAAERGQTLMLRIPPYSADIDVPVWYRKMVGKEVPSTVAKWRVDHEDPLYVKYYGDMEDSELSHSGRISSPNIYQKNIYSCME